jgi:hypothetical protein
MEPCIDTPVRTTGINSQFVYNNGKATINDIIIRVESEKYWTWIKVNDSDKHTSFLHHGINNGCKRFMMQATAGSRLSLFKMLNQRF